MTILSSGVMIFGDCVRRVWGNAGAIGNLIDYGMTHPRVNGGLVRKPG